MRRGAAQPYSFTTLWTYVLAPAWLIDNLHAAYATVKYLTVIVMTATVFPAYGIARLFVGRRPALFVAAASAAIPAVAYSSMIVEEPFAYFWSTLALFLILRALITPSRWWIGGAVVASLIAPLVRGELAMLPAIFLLAGNLPALAVRVRLPVAHGWSGWDWVGFVTLVVGAVVIVSAVLGHRSLEWNYATRLYKGRMLDLGLDAAGALTIGLGVLPVVAGLAVLWRAPGEPVSYALRVFRSVLLAAIISFGLYTAVKATYVSISFGTYTYERNLIYLAPLLFTGTALWLERRRLHPIALAASSAFVLVLILTTPYDMGQDLSYNAPGLAILQQANRYLQLDPTGAKIGLVALLGFSIVLLLAPRFVGRGAKWLVVAVAAAVVAWNLTAEISFASASNRASDRFEENIRAPFTWVDDATGGAPTLYIGQQMSDQNGEWLLEFWNRSIKAVWSLDGTAQGPGPFLTPDPRSFRRRALTRPRATPTSSRRRESRSSERLSPRIFHRAGGGLETWRLVKVAPPLRLRGSVVGVYSDGWTGAFSAYTRYSTEGNRAGTDSSRRLPRRLGRAEQDRARHRRDRANGHRRRQAAASGQADRRQAVRHPQQGRDPCRAEGAGATLPRRGDHHADLRSDRTGARSVGPATAGREGELRVLAAAESRAQVAEAHGEQESCQRPAPLERIERTRHGSRQRDVLRREERTQLQSIEPCRAQVGADVLDAVLPRIQVEDELPLGVPGDAAEEGGAVVRVVDRAEARGSRDRLGRLVVVEVAEHDVAAAPFAGLDHLRARIDAQVANSRQVVGGAAVAAGEIEHSVAGLERRAEAENELSAVSEIGRRVCICDLRPALRLCVVFPPGHRSAKRRSGCLRRKRSIACRCQRFRRVKKCLSITA